jgi:hypothetical protein
MARAMGIVSVRFASYQMEVITPEATRAGVSTSQYIRDATYARAVLGAATHADRTLRLVSGLITLAETNGHEGIAATLRDVLEDGA